MKTTNFYNATRLQFKNEKQFQFYFQHYSKRFYFLLISIYFLVFCISCGSVKNMNFVDKSNDDNISGVYENSNSRGNIIFLLDRKLLKDTIDRKIKYDRFKIHFEDKKLMTISIFADNGTIIKSNFKFKNKDGIYYLKNKNVKPLLVPFIFGALDEKRLYFYKNKKGNLNINSFESTSGAIFIVGFFGGHKSADTTNFKKID